MKKTGIILVVAGIITVLIILLNPKQINQPVELFESRNIQENIIVAEPLQLEENIAVQPLYIINEQCKPILKMVAKNDKKWFKVIDSFLPDYLGEYDKNTVIKALVLLDGSFFAYRKRELLKLADDNSSERNKRTESAFLSLFGEGTPRGLSFSLGIKELKSAFELSKREREEFIEKFGLLVNEVIRAIKSKEFSNEQIIELMSLLKDVNGSTHNVANYQPDDLLDGIIDARNKELLSAYLSLGGKIENREFSVNVFERLLYGVTLKGGGVPNDLIEFLAEINLPIRISYSNNASNQISLGAYWQYPILNKESFDKIILDFNLVLEDAPKKELLRDDIRVMEVYELLKGKKYSFFGDKLAMISNSEIELCQSARIKRYQQLNSEKGKEKMEEATRLFGGDIPTIIS